MNEFKEKIERELLGRLSGQKEPKETEWINEEAKALNDRINIKIDLIMKRVRDDNGGKDQYPKPPEISTTEPCPLDMGLESILTTKAMANMINPLEASVLLIKKKEFINDCLEILKDRAMKIAAKELIDLLKED